MNFKRIEKKEQTLIAQYERITELQGELPIKEYVQYLKLKKDFGIPYTTEQEEFLNTINNAIL